MMHFFSMDCDHCEDEIKWMNELALEHKQNLVVMGISVDMGMLDSVRAFVQNHKLSYSILLPTDDSHKKLTRIYGGATPQSIIVDGNGNVVEFMIGFNDAIINRFRGILQNLGAK